MISKRIFQGMAQIISHARAIGTQPETSPGDVLDIVSIELAHLLEQENPRFDVARFMQQCDTTIAEGETQ